MYLLEPSIYSPTIILIDVTPRPYPYVPSIRFQRMYPLPSPSFNSIGPPTQLFRLIPNSLAL